LFSTYIQPGMAVLDIGVGGGRTSPYLARNASRYAGIDYASEMLRVCRERYPQWEFLEGSATELSPFQNGSFDVVVMSYNILDDLIPDENRWCCLRECYRVLRQNGFLIFSSHNPRAVLVRLGRGVPETTETRREGRFSLLVHKLFNLSAKFFPSVRASMRKLLHYGTKLPFWRGEGYMLDSESLMTHFGTPRKTIAELVQYGFRFIALQGDDYPLKSHLLITDWYYYVFQKVIL